VENIELITDHEIYEKVILELVPKASHFLWLGTSDLKDLYVNKGKRMVPFLEILSDLIKNKVEIRLIFAKEPGENFQKDFDKYPVLAKVLEQFNCPRVHFKTIIIDGKYAYTGSANLTGAGIGAKSINRRNFEAGIIATDAVFIEKLMKQYDDIWIGKQCKNCERKDYCAEWRELK